MSQIIGWSNLERVEILARVKVEDVLRPDLATFEGIQCAWYAEHLPKNDYLVEEDLKLVDPKSLREQTLPSAVRLPTYKKCLETCSSERRQHLTQAYWDASKANCAYLDILKLMFPSHEETSEYYNAWFGDEALKNLRLALNIPRRRAIPPQMVKDHLETAVRSVRPGYHQYYVIFPDETKLAPSKVGEEVIIEVIDEWLYGPINLSWLRVDALRIHQDLIQKMDAMNFEMIVKSFESASAQNKGVDLYYVMLTMPDISEE